MSAEPNAVYRMPMRTVSPQERRAEPARLPKGSAKRVRVEAYVTRHAHRLTAPQMASELGCRLQYVYYVCRELDIRPKAPDAPLPPAQQQPSFSAGDDFVPQPRDISELPALPGSEERKAALAKLVAEGKELFIPEDRDRVNEALMAACGARIEAFSMERAG